jgi:hypothetical protein
MPQGLRRGVRTLITVPLGSLTKKRRMPEVLVKDLNPMPAVCVIARRRA